MVTPLMVVFLQFMDLWFLVFTVLLKLVLWLFSWCCSDKTERAVTWVDSLYEYVFEMQKLDVAGFRRMRTISQLTFESIVQILLQTRILLFLELNEGDYLFDRWGNTGGWENIDDF